MKLPRMLMIMCVIAGCAQASEERKSAAPPPQPQAAAPASASSQPRTTAPAPTPAAAPTPAPTVPTSSTATGGSPGGEWGMVSGTVTKIDKGMGLLELQTPSGWSQFILTEPERKKELERVTVGERVDVKVEFRGSERKVVTVLRQNPPGTPRPESK